WSYVTDEPLDFQLFRVMIRALPHTIFRAKGVLYFADAPLRRGLLHVVGKRVRLSVGDEWGATKPSTQVVVIGSAGGIDAAALRAAFEDCLARQAIRPDPAWFVQPQELDRPGYATADANP
ncbi:MAG TPA: GTP-binding protein, partial [Anaerolineales bacterium]|nr:GTP-binding protein [Anaerolineales bacterium]